MAELSLAELASAADAEPDPNIAARNLAALRKNGPTLAELIERAPLPTSYRPACTLDDSVSYRIESSRTAGEWLSSTAMPRERARALCDQYSVGDLNATLPTIGAGAELRLLLDRLPHYKAVFVFEQDPTRIAAALSIHDFSSEIEQGRCVLLTPGSEEAELERMLAAEPGLLPPGNILCPPDVAGDRIESIRDLCMRIAAETGRQRAARIDELAESYPAAAGRRGSRRIAFLAIGPDTSAVSIAEQLTEAARRLDIESTCMTLKGPRDVHLLAPCQAVHDFGPSITICVNHARRLLPLPIRETACEWIIDPAADATSGEGEPTLRLAASPTIAARLESAPGGDRPILPFYWACDSQQPAAGVPADKIVIVADLPDDSPLACGIEQPTHKMLWSQMRDIARKTWSADEPRTLLAKAERAAGLRLSDASLRGKLLQIIERILIPAALLGRICQTLRNEPAPVVAIGRGWQRWKDQGLTTLSDNLHDYRRRDDRIDPLAAIFAGGPDPLTGQLPVAGSLGWPILLYQPAGRSLSKTLATILIPDRHVCLFSGEKALRAGVRDFAADADKRRELGRRAREHLLAHHTFEHRLNDLLDSLDKPPP